MFKVPEKFRLRHGPMCSFPADGNNGYFVIPFGKVYFIVIASDGMGWEHVSVHCEFKDGKESTPTWDEMCYVKDLFWGEEDVVMQLHPAKSQYVNNHPHTLHLWRPINAEIPTPASLLVGVRSKNELETYLNQLYLEGENERR